MSAHQKILMSWERDYPLGLQATRAPVLYALVNIPDKLKDIKGMYFIMYEQILLATVNFYGQSVKILWLILGGWMDRAKLIWATWRKTSVAKRDEYCVSVYVCLCVCVCVFV